MTFEEEIYYDEKGLEALYAEFSAKLATYISDMEDNISSLNDVIGELGRYWDSEDYRAFKRGMGQGITSTESQIQRAIELKHEIDLARAETAAGLEKMRIRYGFD
ncbi:MAG: hypothetical protein IKC87_06735 [Clostridia bacterium]|nr:hypothetical protein [Clostridia bacterium]